MADTAASKSHEIRSGLNHPVIDSDGHTVEFLPGFYDVLRTVAGQRVVDRYRNELTANNPYGSLANLTHWFELTPEERRIQRAPRGPWWALPIENALDRATAMLPKLMYSRLDEMGMDFSVIYPTVGLLAPHLEDEEIRRASCRAFNQFHAEIFGEFADRIAPVALIPMHTPAEAIDELEYAVKTLGMKAIVMAGHVIRTIPAAADAPPQIRRYAHWLDNLCLDSEYDYDPVWAKCVELKVPATFHSVGMGWGSRTSISNWKYNSFRRGGRGVVQGDVLRRRDAAIPDAQMRIPRGWHRMGVRPLCRPGGALGQAQSPGGRAIQSEESQLPETARIVRELRREDGRGQA
jgi:hypothetical protein